MPRSAFGFVQLTNHDGRPVFVRPDLVAAIGTAHDPRDNGGPLFPQRAAAPYRLLTLVSGAQLFVEDTPRLLAQLGAADLPADDDL
jgi:hypothetical protein